MDTDSSLIVNPESADEGNILPCVRSVLDRFHEAGINYCHWKSNEHVLAGMQGKTDLDILVDHSQRNLSIKIMQEAGYKRFQAVSASAYPGVEDYIALDPRSLWLSHLHVHYRLTVGEKHLKGYRLPWESQILEGRVFDENHKIFISQPEIEFILLVIRSALKLSLRDRYRRIIGLMKNNNDEEREFRWLKERSHSQIIQGMAEKWLGSDGSKSLDRIFKRGLSPSRLYHFRASVKGQLNHFRYYSRLQARFVRQKRELGLFVRRIHRHLGFKTMPVRRILSHGGIVVAFVGVDGAGKSSQVSSLAKVLSQKLDVSTVYFGSGDGNASFLRSIIRALMKFSQQNKRSSTSSRVKKLEQNKLSWRRVPWSISLVWEKRRKMRQVWKASSKGIVVLTDRYPQREVYGYNDGPLLNSWIDSGTWIKKRIAQWEDDQYKKMLVTPPDLVIKLMLSPEAALTRKSDTNKEMARLKAASIKKMNFPSQTECVEVDASYELDFLKSKISKIVWDKI